jgi:hypothetical protein
VVQYIGETREGAPTSRGTPSGTAVRSCAPAARSPLEVHCPSPSALTRPLFSRTIALLQDGGIGGGPQCFVHPGATTTRRKLASACLARGPSSEHVPSAAPRLPSKRVSVCLVLHRSRHPHRPLRPPPLLPPAVPTSFASGRCQVERFPGEGGRKQLKGIGRQRLHEVVW